MALQRTQAGPHANEAGPSFHCATNFPGDARMQRRGLFASTLLMFSVALQGCDSSSISASWDAKPKYLVEFHVKPAGKTDAEPILNSCAASADLSGQPACSGNGKCKEWLAGGVDSEPVSFCACGRDWADPECRTRRKSQAQAFKFSLFGGFLGLDSFYLGQHAVGMAKLATLGGMGAWWAFDVIRIGSAPIKTANYRLAADLEPWIFITYSMLVFAFIGLCVFFMLECHLRRQKATGITFIGRDEALTCLPVPAVGYGTLTPADPNAKCLASVPPGLATLPVAPAVPAVEPTLVGVPVPEAVKAPDSKAPESNTVEAKVPAKVLSRTPSAPGLFDQGATAPLSEVGYGTVAATRSNEQMKIYIKRVVEHDGGRIEDEDCEEFSRFVSEYSGVDFVRSFRRMSDALRRAPWVTHEKAAAPTSARVGDLTFFLPCLGGEGEVLMNEVGRPAVANIDLILKGLTQDAPILNEDGDAEAELEEEKPAQVQSPAESFKAHDAAQRLGLVLPPLDIDEASPKATPQPCTLESVLQLSDDPIMEPQVLDPVTTFVIPERFDGQVGLVPGARPPQPCIVKAIVPGSWADSCDVRLEDEILAVNSISISELDHTSFHEGSVQNSPRNSHQGSAAVAPLAVPASL